MQASAWIERWLIPQGDTLFKLSCLIYSVLNGRWALKRSFDGCDDVIATRNRPLDDLDISTTSSNQSLYRTIQTTSIMFARSALRSAAPLKRVCRLLIVSRALELFHCRNSRQLGEEAIMLRQTASHAFSSPFSLVTSPPTTMADLSLPPEHPYICHSCWGQRQRRPGRSRLLCHRRSSSRWRLHLLRKLPRQGTASAPTHNRDRRQGHQCAPELAGHTAWRYCVGFVRCEGVHGW